MKNDIYVFVSDAGHGWLTVTIEELIDLGIAEKISSYSYVKENIAYLEEDCDAPLFVKTYNEKYAELPKWEEVYVEDAPLRNYQRYDHKQVQL
jgi:CTP:phosphocholine cytidylyltransferase-like protein